MLRRRPAIDRDTLPEDLGVDWSRWDDGRAHRLKRRRDFPNVDPGHARKAAEFAAHGMGRAIRTTRDKRIPDKLIWIQFADGYIEAGAACPRCGSRRLLRLHADFIRCPSCKAQLLLWAGGVEGLDDPPVEGVVGPRARKRAGNRLR